MPGMHGIEAVLRTRAFDSVSELSERTRHLESIDF